MAQRFTQRQGQYLTFLHLYTTLNKRPPAESDFQAYFGVSAPSVHQMIVALTNLGLIQRTPGQARSLRLLVPPKTLPGAWPCWASCAIRACGPTASGWNSA